QAEQTHAQFLAVATDVRVRNSPAQRQQANQQWHQVGIHADKEQPGAGIAAPQQVTRGRDQGQVVEDDQIQRDAHDQRTEKECLHDRNRNADQDQREQAAVQAWMPLPRVHERADELGLQHVANRANHQQQMGLQVEVAFGEALHMRTQRQLDQREADHDADVVTDALPFPAEYRYQHNVQRHAADDAER